MEGGQAILGESRAIQTLRTRIARVGPTEATVLIRGERGTGKELVAAAVHDASRRRRQPYLALNCAALPDELLASELFGHERGAFTGAVQRALGVLAAADGGTVFLDEVGDLSPRGQAMLLRFLETREVRPLGVAHALRVNVRVVAATNRDLVAAGARGEFRADLYDRLSEVVLEAPPLRERREDIARLAEHFAGVYARRHGVAVSGLAREAVRALCAYDWPGNVRELEKAISRAVIFAEDGWISAADLGLPLSDGVNGRSLDGVDSQAGPFSALTSALTRRQREVLLIASLKGAVGRRDVTARFAISGESARRDLVALGAAGLLRRSGRGRATRYVPVGVGAHAHAAGRPDPFEPSGDVPGSTTSS